MKFLRDAQEEARILCAALRDAAGKEGDPPASHVTEAAATLEALRGAERGKWEQMPTDRERAVGLTLLVGLALASDLEVDSLQALKSVLLDESP